MDAESSEPRCTEKLFDYISLPQLPPEPKLLLSVRATQPEPFATFWNVRVTLILEEGRKRKSALYSPEEHACRMENEASNLSLLQDRTNVGAPFLRRYAITLPCNQKRGAFLPSLTTKAYK